MFEVTLLVYLISSSMAVILYPDDLGCELEPGNRAILYVDDEPIHACWVQRGSRVLVRSYGQEVPIPVDYFTKVQQSMGA